MGIVTEALEAVAPAGAVMPNNVNKSNSANESRKDRKRRKKDSA